MPASSTPASAGGALLAGTGEMAARIRAFPWDTTSLGPAAAWPASLRTLVSMMLESELPIALGWGVGLTCLYNDAYRPLLGNRPEALGRPFREVWPEARKMTEPVIQRALEGKPSCFRDARFVLERNGAPEHAYFDYWIGPVRDENGQVMGLINEAIETSQRVLAERRQRFRTRLSDALRNLSDPREIMAVAARRLGRHLRADRVGYAELDETGEFFTVERDWVREDMPSGVGRHRLSEFGPKLVAEALTGVALRVSDPFEDPRVDPEAARVHHALGGLRGSLTVPLVKGGRLAAFLAVQQREPRQWTDEDEVLVREVAERTWAAVERARAEAALRATSNRLRLILENTTGYGILTIDLKGRITLWNPGAERLMGWREDEVLGKPADLFFTPQDRDQAIPEREMKRAVESGRAVDDRQHMRKDGTRFFASGLMMPLRNGGGRLLGYLKVLRDRTLEHQAQEALERGVAERTAELAATNRQLLAQIEERERVEATLRQMQRLEAVGQLTSGVAHDFNNLLTVISGNIGILERALSGPGIDPALRQRLGYMKDAATRGAKLTAQLLAFSRRQRLEAKAVDLNGIVVGMRDLLQSSMGGSVQLGMKLQQGLWPALVDPTQIELVILNLAINARDASPVGGDLMVETANVAVREPAARPEEPCPGDYVMVAVTDHGSGMTPEVLARAFEPFFTTKEVGKGSGLGLAQVYGFAKQSGGGVRIDTRLGEGTSIKVYLPRAAGVAAESEAVMQEVVRQDNGPARQRILLVDDDADVREVTAAILTERGYEVIEAGSGGSALDVLEREGGTVDLMLMDYAMPGMNGSEVAREAHARRPSLPIVFLTGYADFAAFKEVGDDRIVSKPFRDEDLLAKVCTVLDSHRRDGAPRPGA
ncbi:PAS domain-containing protein [Frateuria hangzhouensis]|uniref:PAS domain-containing protein n=1 Tax=Frateuria hangzhouensis TaxID=2995589 RepID=UPI0022609B59|nr:PAS domain-containing protein [Frateuria sp. STR12]MCX7515355.1 PAS domain-containing protein [Frateuria sp. STR12]